MTLSPQPLTLLPTFKEEGSTWSGGRGPKMRAPWCEGKDATYSTLGQEHCLHDRGHRWQMDADSCAVPQRVAITEYEQSSNNGWMNRCYKETSRTPWIGRWWLITQKRLGPSDSTAGRSYSNIWWWHTTQSFIYALFTFCNHYFYCNCLDK